MKTNKLGLAALLALPLQDPITGPLDDEGWQLLDGVAAQAGEGIVTMRALDLYVREAIDEERESITSQEQFDAASNAFSVKGLRQLVIAELEAQGGQDMGLDPTQIEQMVSHDILNRRKELGAAAYLDQLSADGTDALGDLTSRSERLYRLIWARDKLGMGGPAGDRPSRDRFIRPGELKLIYRSNRDSLRPPDVNLQMIVMPIAAAGTMEEAEATMADVRARALAGEDFGDLVDQYSSEGRERRGIMGLTSLTNYGNTPMAQWAATAPVGEFSPVLPMPPSQPQVLMLARMHEREDPGPPEFVDEPVQQTLRQVFTNIRDNRIMDIEHAKLGEVAYTWLHPGLRGAREALMSQGLVGPRAKP